MVSVSASSEPTDCDRAQAAIDRLLGEAEALLAHGRHEDAARLAWQARHLIYAAAGAPLHLAKPLDAVRRALTSENRT